MEKFEFRLNEKDKDCVSVYMTDDVEEGKTLISKGEVVLLHLTEENKDADTSFCKYAYMGDDAPEIDFLQKVYKRYKKLPLDILETKRLLVRESTVTDVYEFEKIYADEEITRYTEGLFTPIEKEIEYAMDYIKNVYELCNYGIWTLVEKMTGEVIGRAGVTNRPDQDELEIGFVIGKAKQRQGFAFEALEAIIKYAHENITEEPLVAWVDERNIPSRKLLEKLGFTYTNVRNENLILYKEHD